MKLKFIASILIAALSLSAFSANQKMSQYYSVNNQPKLSANALTYVPPTDITIINSTYNVIYAAVPSSPINDMIYSGGNDHIRHDTLYADTRLVLQDPYRNVFFDRYVCRRAVVSVMGNPGAYRVNIDNEYCY